MQSSEHDQIYEYKDSQRMKLDIPITESQSQKANLLVEETTASTSMRDGRGTVCSASKHGPDGDACMRFDQDQSLAHKLLLYNRPLQRLLFGSQARSRAERWFVYRYRSSPVKPEKEVLVQHVSDAYAN